MKRVGNLWANIITFDNLLLAAKKAQRCKRFKPDILKFNYRLESEILKLQRELITKTYRTGEYKTFQIIDPKPRSISAAPYRDRVVHHAVCNIIAPIFERTFIADSYANRIGFGTHKALEKFTHFTRTSKYILQCDISKYFPSIDHEILKSIIHSKIKCPDTLWLIDQIIDRSNPQDLILERFPNDNLLTPIERRKGLPLGNLTSQLFANIYLNELDQFVKHELKSKKYVRYLDDFALFSNKLAYLQSAQLAITDFLINLRLKLHPIKTQLFKTDHGVNFVGFRIFASHKRVLAKNIRRGKKRIRLLQNALKAGNISQTKLISSCQAWIGHLQHGDTWKLQQQLFSFLEV
ncbi:MAG: reverse transcriptase domain-containing protein [Pseudanabaena sp.]|jgi:retron-type reverse transcriptase